jgi:hypothetical protein
LTTVPNRLTALQRATSTMRVSQFDLGYVTTCGQAAISAFRIATITALAKLEVVAVPPRSAVCVPPPMAPATPSRNCCAVERHAGSRVRWYSHSINCAVDRISAAGLAKTLASDIRRCAVDCLRHGMIAASVQRGREADAAGETRCLIGKDVAEQVGGGDEAIFLVPAREGRTERIDPQRIERDRRIFGIDFLEGADEQILGLRQGGALVTICKRLSPRAAA